jgi:hypothetical protein
MALPLSTPTALSAGCRMGNITHRIDGPAMEYPTGDNRWFINGKELTEAEFNQAVKLL